MKKRICKHCNAYLEVDPFSYTNSNVNYAVICYECGSIEMLGKLTTEEQELYKEQEYLDKIVEMSKDFTLH